MYETLMVGKLHSVLNSVKSSFFDYFHSKVFFLILAHVCFTFRICYDNRMRIQIFELLLVFELIAYFGRNIMR